MADEIEKIDSEETDFNRTPLKKSIRFNPFQVDYKNREIVVQPSSIDKRLDLSMNNAKGGAGAYLGRHVDFTSADTTPSVKNANIFETAGTTRITDFDDGKVGQVIFIKATGSITISDGGQLSLKGDTDFNMQIGDTITLAMFDDQVWHEISRSIARATGIYGEMFGDNISETVTIGATDTFVEVGGSLSTGVVRGVTFQNSKELKILTAGDYLINFAIGVKTTTANDEVEGRIMINSTSSPTSSTHSTLPKANVSEEISGTTILTLAVDDVVKVAVANHNAVRDIIIEHLNLSILKVG